MLVNFIIMEWIYHLILLLKQMKKNYKGLISMVFVDGRFLTNPNLGLKLVFSSANFIS